jgi:hypothetical protein
LQEKVYFAGKTGRNRYEILYYLCEAEDGGKVKKSDIAMKFDMISIQKSMENEERTIQPVQK